jgi:Holliday junction DNA helicase RuvA
MIRRLSGKLLECEPGELLLDVAGVGYGLQISLNTFYAIAASANDSLTLHVHTHVREDALQLFGFAEPGERQIFEKLIGITGVGPRLALSILSGIGADELRQAVMDGDRVRLQRIPGVGKKTAERLLLELKDKLDAPTREAGAGLSTRAPSGEAGRDGPRGDALSALTNLGYPRETAARAVDAALAELGRDTQLEPLLRAALGNLMG